jgi:hypothetical protein
MAKLGRHSQGHNLIVLPRLCVKYDVSAQDDRPGRWRVIPKDGPREHCHQTLWEVLGVMHKGEC